MVDDREPRRLAQLCSVRVERDLDTVLIHLNGEFDAGCERRFLELGHWFKFQKIREHNLSVWLAV